MIGQFAFLLLTAETFGYYTKIPPGHDQSILNHQLNHYDHLGYFECSPYSPDDYFSKNLVLDPARKLAHDHNTGKVFDFVEGNVWHDPEDFANYGFGNGVTREQYLKDYAQMTSTLKQLKGDMFIPSSNGSINSNNPEIATTTTTPAPTTTVQTPKPVTTLPPTQTAEEELPFSE